MEKWEIKSEDKKSKSFQKAANDYVFQYCGKNEWTKMPMFARNMFNQIMRFPEKTLKIPVKSNNFQTGLKICWSPILSEKRPKAAENIQNLGKVRITANFENCKNL